jgi:hypothetical protein
MPSKHQSPPQSPKHAPTLRPRSTDPDFTNSKMPAKGPKPGGNSDNAIEVLDESDTPGGNLGNAIEVLDESDSESIDDGSNGRDGSESSTDAGNDTDSPADHKECMSL